MRSLSRASALLALSLLVGSGCCVHPFTPTQRIDCDVSTLAADAFEGRDTGSAKNREAAEWIAARMAALGLEGIDPTKTGAEAYFQLFETPLGKSLVDGNRFAAGAFVGKLGEDFVPSEFSRSGHAAGAVVAVRARPDDQVDLAGTLALGFMDAGGADATQQPKMHVANASSAQHLKFIEWAYAHGAAGAIVVLPDDALPVYAGRAPYEMSIPAVLVRRTDAAKILEPSKLDVDALSAQLAGNPTVALDGVLADLAIATKANMVSVPNVMGIVPPPNATCVLDPKTNAYIRGGIRNYLVIGAHFDHIGFGGDSRSRGAAGQIHNGADDNASGVAALLEVARALAEHPLENTAVIFIAFNGEELGLLGSQHYVKHPIVPLDQTWAMINMDMVGRAHRGPDAKHASDWNYLSLGGTPSAAAFSQIVADAHVAIGAPFQLDPDVGVFNASSDHISFYVANVPVLFCFTGLHNEYHTDKDDADLIDAHGDALCAQLVTEIVRGIDRLKAQPAYVAFEKAPAGPTTTARPIDPKTGSPYGPWFGSIPEMAQRDDGVGIQGVQPGSPLEAAGGKPGDVMTHFDGKEVMTLKDFATLLRAKQVGDTVEVLMTRDGKPVTLHVTLTPKIPK